MIRSTRATATTRTTGMALARAALVLACLSCSSEKPNATAMGAAATVPTVDPLAIHFETGPFTIQNGDNFECFYTDTITDRAVNIHNATGAQGPGGHHLIVYYADQKQPVGHHPCIDAEMIALHQIAAVSGNKEGIISLPDGVATKVAEGKQLVIQSHYIRTEDGPLTVNDTIDLHTLEDKDVAQFANSFVMVDQTFNVPPRSSATSVSLCTTPQDFDLLILIGHMHEWGSHYKLETVDTAGKAIDTLYDATWEPLFVAHPPVKNFDPKQPLHLPKGTRIRQTCTWQNPDDEAKTFPREMCVMFSYYVPDNGFIQCDTTEVMQ